MGALKDVMEKVDSIKPIAKSNGLDLVTFEDQRDLAVAEALNGKKLNTISFNQDGSVARTPCTCAAINPNSYYINRFRVLGDELWVVHDYRACTEQETGSVYMKQIPCHVLVRDAKKNLVVDRVTVVSDDVFISQFTNVLDNNAMAEILPLLSAGAGISTHSLPI